MKKLIVWVSVFLLIFLAQGFTQSNITGSEKRLIVGGRGAALVVDALYAFPELRSRLIATIKPDQGFGLFLTEVDADFPAKAVLARTAGAESYAALKPDAVLLKSYMKGSLGASLSALGIKTAYFDLESPDDYYRDLTTLGTTFNQNERAAALTSYYKQLQDDTARRVSKLAPVRTLLVQAGAGTGVWEATPAAWMQTRLVALAGGLPVWVDPSGGASTQGWLKLGAEQIAAWNPDVVIVVAYSEDSAIAANSFRTDVRFAQLKAVKSNRVFAMPQDYYSWDQPVTRWILALRRMAAFIHPEVFTDVDPESEARSFFKFVYGFQESTFDQKIRPVLKGDHGLH